MAEQFFLVFSPELGIKSEVTYDPVEARAWAAKEALNHPAHAMYVMQSGACARRAISVEMIDISPSQPVLEGANVRQLRAEG